MRQASSVLKFCDLGKEYLNGDNRIEVLKGVNLSLAQAEVCSLVGPSGSGKTTLLGLAVGLDNPSKGQVEVCGQNLSKLSEEQRAKLRNQKVGFVFQSFQLIQSLTALENVLVPAELLGIANAVEKARDLLVRVGLEKRASHYPTQLSGGEQQRVAIARAFINDPELLLADEPTGNLDEETAMTIEELLFELHREHGTGILIATHNMRLAGKAGRKVFLEHGVLREEQ